MNIAFYSTMTALPWGGSEVLWAAAAEQLVQDDHPVTVCFKHWLNRSPNLNHLINNGARLIERNPPRTRTQQRLQRWLPRLGLSACAEPHHLKQFLNPRPDLITVTAGYHLDWSADLEAITQSGIPYLINLQVADRFTFPDDDTWNNLRAFYRNAAMRCFLSEDNRAIMEELLCQPMAPYRIVDNPIRTRPASPLPFPSDAVHSLACIGRLQFASKGHDLLVDALADPFWEDTPIHITFYGEDQDNTAQLKARIASKGLEHRFSFGGYCNDPSTIYSRHAAIVLPSRFEGLPMITAEAMHCGRIPIVTACGRNPDWVDDGETGFLIPDCQRQTIQSTLRRAWEARHQWEVMGIEAHKRIKTQLPDDPVGDFKNLILSLKP